MVISKIDLISKDVIHSWNDCCLSDGVLDAFYTAAGKSVLKILLSPIKDYVAEDGEIYRLKLIDILWTLLRTEVMPINDLFDVQEWVLNRISTTDERSLKARNWRTQVTIPQELFNRNRLDAGAVPYKREIDRAERGHSMAMTVFKDYREGDILSAETNLLSNILQMLPTETDKQPLIDHLTILFTP